MKNRDDDINRTSSVSVIPGVGELMVASFPVSIKFHRTIRPSALV